MLAAVEGRLDTPVFTDDGPRETGFPLLINRTHRAGYTDPEGGVHEYKTEDREEITEFSEEDLESGLFVRRAISGEAGVCPVSILCPSVSACGFAGSGSRIRFWADANPAS